MAVNFIVEDGTGLPNATSLASIAEFLEYGREQGFPVDQYPSGYDDKIMVALNQATRHMEIRFARFLVGGVATDTQSLSWPRLYVPNAAGTDYLPSDEVPLKVKQACIEYAQRALKSPLDPDIKVDASGQIVTQEMKKVGPIQVMKKFLVGSKAQLRQYAVPDSMMSEFLIPSGGYVIRN